MTFNAIAEWLNKEGYLTVRGKKFRGAHVHSILKKRLAKEELLKREYPEVWSDVSMEVVDKTILMSDFGCSQSCGETEVIIDLRTHPLQTTPRSLILLDFSVGLRLYLY